MNENEIADTIANANPVPKVVNEELRSLSPAETELCEAIMSLPTLTPIDHALSAAPPATTNRQSERLGLSSGGGRPRRRRWTLVAGASAAAALVGLLVLSLPGGSRSNIAFAEWSPAPQPVSPGERAAIETACEVAGPELEVPIFDGALIDRRGSIAAALGLSGDDRMTCAAHFLSGSWYAFGAAVDRGGDPLQPGLMRGWNSDGAEINVVDGFAPDAATIEVDAPDVPTATATVVGGRYIVWLPQSFDWTDSVAGIQIRYLDAAGQTLQTFDL